MKSGITSLLTGLSLVLVSCLGAVPAEAAPAVGSFTNGTFANVSGLYSDNSGNGYESLQSESTAISGWTVIDVDWINTYWKAPGGNSIDLNGNGAGGVWQTFHTISGATYDVSFWLAGNFDPSSIKTTWTAMVWTQRPGNVKYFTVTEPDTWSHQDMGFQLKHYVFTATATSTKLTFFGDLNTMYWGPVIADVSVVRVPTSGVQCKDPGWQLYSNPSTLMPFMNQGQCVSYFATLGDTPIGSSNSSWLNN